MSIKCSLLGHRFDETSVERDRQEDGSEVVITITELETCSRCGETRVVSENKEVTTMEAPDPDPEADRAGGAEAGADAESEDPVEDYDPEGDDAEILDADGAEADAQAEARTAAIPDAESDDGTRTEPPEEDDAVIIDGDDGPPATADDGPASEQGSAASDDPGSASAGGTGDPSSGTGTGGAGGADADAGAAEWPDDESADAGDADADSEPVMTGETGGDWPEEPASPGAQQQPMDEWPEATKRDDRGDAGGGPTLEESASPTITVPEGMFKCSECGFETEVESSSLRAGDFCPECHSGTLMQHEDENAEA